MRTERHALSNGACEEMGPHTPLHSPHEPSNFAEQMGRRRARIKAAYRRHWPARPVPDTMSRNYRMTAKRPLWLVLLLLLAVLLVSAVKGMLL
jgi:hypothetical protein